MINYRDLMIGNWVYESERSKFPMQVVGIYEDYCYLNFEGNESDPFDGFDKYMMPIEVTEELLSKIGFEPSDYPNEEGYATYNKDTEDYDVSICKFKNKWFCEIDVSKCGNAGNFYFKYLHELQNGIRLTTKSDLEIKEL